jgi:hypothetical protein
MTRNNILPLTMGFAMGLLMLWMVHRQLASPDTLGFAALATFIGTHVLVAVVVLALPAWFATRIPRLHRILSRVHHPSRNHMALMLAGAVAATLTTHLWIHGGVI